MVELQRGLVVAAKAGRDKGRYFAVLGVEGERAFLADGDMRKLEKPKAKNLRHLALTKTVLSEQALLTNKQLHKALREGGFTPQTHTGATRTPEGGNTLG
ncbi:KOW domain-containing RNA-binding protein [Ruminococcaceae bacterium OttesenSCG-928-N02]|nr:KOW domain-containing RNA-binding protein [Ruminococcaceae bacterium OttesenSCG-928-N02]